MTDRPTPVRVSRTGLAVVHEGEVVLPAVGSAAEAEALAEAGQITYVFPVVVEVCRLDAELNATGIVDAALRQLTIGLHSLRET